MLLLTLLLWISAMSAMAQNKAANIWASVQFNKRTVMVGEPLMVTITVYTSTWFTSPPEFSEIQVPEAMMVEYQQRTGSIRKTVGNRSYPAIEKKFVVYPFRVGENALPSLNIVTESPPEGDFKGRRRVIKSPERTFTVLAPPDGIQNNKWLTAFDLSLTERWNRPLDNLKQGDVPERQITIRAEGALAALIPPLEPKPGSFGNVYSRAADLSNVQDKDGFTGTRSEYWTYLLDSEGRHSIPGIEISWFDPRSGELKQTKLEEKEILVAENPDMEFILSMQDSLQALLETGDMAGEKEAFEWMGLSWWQLLALGLSISVLIVFLIRLFRKMAETAREKKTASRESEQWYFEQLVKAGKDKPEIFMSALLSWYDRFRKDPEGRDRFGPTLESFVCAHGNDELGHSLTQLEGIVFGGAEPEGWSGNLLSGHLREARKQAIGKQDPASKGLLLPLNPDIEEPVPCKNSK